MNFSWQTLRDLPRLLNVQSPDLVQQESRIRFMEVNIALPVKGLIIGMLFYYLFFSEWLDDVLWRGDEVVYLSREHIWNVVRIFFLAYVALNAAVAWLLLSKARLSAAWLHRVTFHIAWVDAFFLAALTMLTGGFDSVLFWGFLGLVIRNAVSSPSATRQILLNGIVILSYLTAGVADALMYEWQLRHVDPETELGIEPGSGSAEAAVVRLALLILMAICGYGLQLLTDRQRLVEAEAREFAMRQQQLQAQGRLAAEIAHQLKNPLGIINNAAFTLQRTVKEGKTITQQIQIIREEVHRSDRIITELMGYARLTEGTVEKIDTAQALDEAIDRVFPQAAAYEVTVHRDYAPALPPLLVQRGHLSEVFINILQNAREAMDGKGNVWVTTRFGEDYSVLITIADDGPGIPADKLPNIFEPYFTTKEKGTGLGLAIVKHNTEIYGGDVTVESALGMGTRFTVHLPAKTIMKLRR